MSNQYFWERIAGPDPNIRAADADRERAADRLRKGHSEGRLDMTEFQERLERCYEAKTMGELRALVRDLPRQDELLQRRSAGQLRQWRWRLAPIAPILILLLIVSALGGHDHISWLWLPVLFVIMRMWWWRRRRWSAGPRHGADDWI
jgi:DUF1707 SHOCT-like domain